MTDPDTYRRATAHCIGFWRAVLRRLRASRRGSVSTVIAAITPVLIGFMGLAIDTTYWETNKVSIQGATDQAAVAAGRAYRSNANVTTEAVSMLAAHGFVNGVNGTTVAVNNPPLSGTYAGNAAAIAVTVTQPQHTIFASVLRITPPTLHATALVAPSVTGGGACIIALATTGTALSLNGTNTVDISLCNIYNNSTSSTATSMVGGALVKVRDAYLASTAAAPVCSVDQTSGMCAIKAIHTGASPVADPYATRAVPSVPSRCDANNAAYSSSVSFTAKADGMYVFCNGIKLTSGGTLNFGPGIYIIDRGTFSINGSWTINGTSASVFFTSSTSAVSADLKVNANQIINFTAPLTGVAKGIAWWINRNASSSTLSFGGGSTLNITGAIYAAATAVTISGNNGSAKCTQVVARTITFNGNNTFKHDCTGVGISDPPGSLPALALVQ